MASFGFHVSYPCFQGDGRFDVPFYLFQGCNHDGWFLPPPPPKKKFKNWKMAHFGLLAGFSHSFWFRYRDWGSFTCFKIVDQTWKLQPSVNNISNVCFCHLKELVTNLRIESSCVNFLRDKPLLPGNDCHGTNRYSLRLFILFSTTKTI